MAGPAPPSRPVQMGLVLSGLLAGAWLTAVPYLAVRAGASSPVRLAVVDGVHAYSGCALLAAVLVKTRRLGLRPAVAGVAGVTLAQRWLSGATGILVAAVGATGAAAAVVRRQPLATDLAHAHLVAAVWAAVPATAHVWGHRHRARQRLARPAGWVGLGLAAAAAGVLIAPEGRVASPLAYDGAGAAWERAGPSVFLDALVGDGDRLVAGGAGLYVSGPAGGGSPAPPTGWRRVGPFDDHRLVLGLPGRVGPLGFAVGATDGLWAAPTVQGPYRRLALPAGDVRDVVWFAGGLWATSDRGVWRSGDGGTTWNPASAGLSRPTTAWAMAAFAGSLYASDETEVYRWGGGAWRRSSAQRAVVQLDGDPARRSLFASSMGDGLAVLGPGGGWRRSQAGLAAHDHGAVRGTHVVSVETGGPTLYAGSMLEGAAVSHDGGASWSLPWSDLGGRGVVWRVVPASGWLVAATDNGLLDYRLPPQRAATPAWWAAVAGGGAVVGALVAAVAARRPRRWRGARAGAGAEAGPPAVEALGPAWGGPETSEADPGGLQGRL